MISHNVLGDDNTTVSCFRCQKRGEGPGLVDASILNNDNDDNNDNICCYE